MTRITPDKLGTRELHRLLTSAIAPRPIAFVSTINKNGLPNAAPFCFFMGVAPNPPTIAISIIRRGDQKKDTIRNIEENREFVVNIVDESLAQAMNLASGSYPSDMSEFDLTGLTPQPSEKIGAPRISESPVHLECKAKMILELGDIPASLVIGEILCFHIKETLLTKDGIIDVAKLGPIGRMGENLYGTLGNIFEMNRPA